MSEKSYIELHLRHKDDVLVIRGDTVEELSVVVPALADDPHLARFLGAYRVGEALAGNDVGAGVKAGDPTSGQPKRPAPAPLTPEDVEAQLHRSSRSKDLADDSRPAGAALRLLVTKKTGQEPPPEITVAEAKSLLKGGVA